MLVCQKDSFSIPEDIHYLNCATLGPMSKASEQAGLEAMMLGRNPLLRERRLFFDPVVRSKQLFGQLINANPDHIAMIPSASYGLATACKNIPIFKDDEVVLLEDQFPSNFYIWKKRCQKEGAQLNIVQAPDSDRKSADWTDRIIASITPKTKVVAMAHVHWMDGTYFDLERIAQTCKQYGTYLVIDGTQSVGALPFDVKKIQPDALIVAGYKWMLGSYGLGHAYFSERMLDGEPLEENWINMERSDEFEHLTKYIDTYRKGAARYNMGEQSSFISMAMTNAALEILNEITPAMIQEYAQNLVKDAWKELADAGIKIDPSKASYHMTGLRFSEKWNLEDIQERLKSNGVITSQRGSALRISVNIFNTTEDIDLLVGCILNRV